MRRALACAMLAALAGCAAVPPAPPPTASVAPPPTPSAAADPVSRAIARHAELARNYEQSGALADAALQWHILTLLDPDDPRHRARLTETRAAVAKAAAAAFASGEAALRAGDTERATHAMLATLALDPSHHDAASALREIDRRKLSRVQADRAAKAKAEDAAASGRAGRNGASTPGAAAGATTAANGANGNATYDLEQRLELLNAGDLASGLRELKAYVDAHPGDRAARARIGNAVFDRARELESRDAREQALSIYEQAVTLRGEPGAGWAARIQSLRKALSADYYDKGVRAWRTDIALAIRQWETSLRYDPQNLRASTRLAEARKAQETLRRIGEAPAAH